MESYEKCAWIAGLERGRGRGYSRYAFWLRRKYFYPHNPQFPDHYEKLLRETSEQQ